MRFLAFQRTRSGNRSHSNTCEQRNPSSKHRQALCHSHFTSFPVIGHTQFRISFHQLSAGYLCHRLSRDLPIHSFHSLCSPHSPTWHALMPHPRASEGATINTLQISTILTLSFQYVIHIRAIAYKHAFIFTNPLFNSPLNPTSPEETSKIKTIRCLTLFKEFTPVSLEFHFLVHLETVGV